jgi:Holliday junction resolvase-like predicted endonuclease
LACTAARRQVGEDELRASFCRFGEVDSITTYAGRNYAFVNMKARAHGPCWIEWRRQP